MDYLLQYCVFFFWFLFLWFLSEIEKFMRVSLNFELGLFLEICCHVRFWCMKIINDIFSIRPPKKDLFFLPFVSIINLSSYLIKFWYNSKFLIQSIIFLFKIHFIWAVQESNLGNYSFPLNFLWEWSAWNRFFPYMK